MSSTTHEIDIDDIDGAEAPIWCRSVNLHYKNDTDLNGVQVMRFVIGADMLASGVENEANRCFCVVPPEEDQQDDSVEEVRRARPAMYGSCMVANLIQASLRRPNRNPLDGAAATRA